MLGLALRSSLMITQHTKLITHIQLLTIKKNTAHWTFSLTAEGASTVNESLHSLSRGTAGCCLTARHFSVFEQQMQKSSDFEYKSRTGEVN